jgi:hypothetical protein
MRQRWISLFAATLAPVVFFPALTFAQVVNAEIHGTVTDSTGALVPNATVTVVNTSTGIKTTTHADKSGYYIFPQLQVGGPYTVTVNASGFQAFASSGLTLNVNDNRDVDAKLQVGSEGQTVEVSATAVQVETSNTQLQQVATADQLEQIPLEGRDPAGLQKLEPGVVESSDRFGTFSSNGNQTAQNSYLVNGIDINDPALQNEGIQVNPDALEEENIVTSTMNPEFARDSGATVNQILKSGTNAFHGSGFEFYRDTFLNNGNYFSQTRPEFHQNLYGGTFGGPIFKDKFFFFLAYQGQRQRSGLTTLQQTLSPGQFSGAFSTDLNYASLANDNVPSTDMINGVPVMVNNSLSTNPIPFAIAGCPAGTPWAICFNQTGTAAGAVINIPNNTWNSLASKLITQFVPQANETIGGVSYYNFNAGNTVANDQGIIKLDYTPSSKDSIWVASIFQSAPSSSVLTFGGGSFPGFGSTEGNHYKLFSANYTHTFTPNLLNDLRASYYRNPFGAVYPSQVVSPSSEGFNITPQDPISGLPYIGIGSYFNLGFSFEGPQPRLDTNLTYADNFTWVRGSHNIKLGAQFEQFRVHNPFDVYNNGIYSYNGGGLYSSGDPLIDFTLGIPDSYEQSNNGFINAVATELFAYAQDNWKVTPDFTFNYGISWDVQRPNEDHQDGGEGIVCFQNSTAESTVFPGAPPGLLFPGDHGCNNAGSPTTKYDHFAPRIGFAYSPSSGPSKLIGEPGAHEFSIRAGFGLYYSRDQEEQSLQNLEDPPNVFVSHGAGDAGGSPAFINPFADVTGNAKTSTTNPFPYTVPPPGTAINWPNYAGQDLATFDPNYNVPYTYNFNLNIQRAIGRNLIAQIGYVGSVSHRLASWHEGDPITAAGHAACLANPSCVTYKNGVPTPGTFLSLIHQYLPQYTADQAYVPGNPYNLTNGTPWYLSDADQTTEGDSSYHSLQASLIMSPRHGLQFTTAYTYSHALDDGSGYESVTGSDNRVYNFVPGFQSLNYGSSDFDARHRFVASYVYTVPVAGFMKNNLIEREALSGWEVAGITVFQTGFPVGIYQSGQHSGWCDAYSYFGCPDVPETTNFNVARLNPRDAGNPWFSKSNFAPEPVGTFGNTPRNFFHGPGFDYTNLQVAKNIHVTSDSRRYVQLRLEAFNAFNHANFANPVGNINNSAFGTIQSVKQSADPNADPSPGRSVQLAGKFYF